MVGFNSCVVTGWFHNGFPLAASVPMACSFTMGHGSLAGAAGHLPGLYFVRLGQAVAELGRRDAQHVGARGGRL